jgi:hypothetical protein
MGRLAIALLFAFPLMAQPTPGAGSIEGRVLNSLTGTPVRKARVRLIAPQFVLVAESDAEGMFRFSGLPPGTYRTWAGRSGFLDRPAGRPRALPENETASGFDIRLMPLGVIAGRILDEGEPVERAEVRLFKQIHANGRKLWGLNQFSRVNDAGEYRFANLRPGRYLLQSHDGREPLNDRYGGAAASLSVPTYYPNAVSEQEAMPVEVGIGAEVRGIDIHLLKRAQQPFVRLRGKVAGVPNPQSTVMVNLRPMEGGPFGGSCLARPPDHAFELRPEPGRYDILAIVYSGSPEAYGTGKLTVTGDMDGVVIPIGPPAELTGQVRLAGGSMKAKLDEVRISLMALGAESGRQTFELRASADGRFGFRKGVPIAASRFAVAKVESLPDGWHVSEIRMGNEDISLESFEIPAPAPLEIVLSSGAGKIAGTAVDGEGKPFPGTSVTLIPVDGKSQPARQTAGEDGSFEFAALRPGEYWVFAWEEVDDDLWQDAEFRKRYETRATRITAGAGERKNVQLRAFAIEEMR